MQIAQTLGKTLNRARPLLAALALLLLAWGLYDGLENQGSQSGRMTLFLGSMVLFGLALLPDIVRNPPGAAPGVPPTGKGPSPGQAKAAAGHLPAPRPANTAITASGGAFAQTSTAVAEPHAAVALLALPAPVPAPHAAPVIDVPAARQVVPAGPLQASAQPPATAVGLLGTTLGELLLDAIGDDPEDSARLLSRAIARALKPPVPALQGARDG